MSGRKLLIDTNASIGLEDEREVAPEFATLQQLVPSTVSGSSSMSAPPTT
jgi:GNAT superfamily N-acetyltransferase